MNPGISEETGRTARHLVDALRSTPALLVIVIFNVVFMAVIAWTTHQQGERWQETVKLVLDSCARSGQ